MDAEVPGRLSDGLAGLLDDPHGPSRNSGSYFLRVSGMASPHRPCLHETGGCPQTVAHELFADCRAVYGIAARVALTRRIVGTAGGTRPPAVYESAPWSDPDRGQESVIILP